MAFADYTLLFFAIAAGAIAFFAVLRDTAGANLLRLALASLAGLGATLTLLATATIWLQQTGDPWNNARLTPAIALHHGFKLYYPLHEGPVLSTVVLIRIRWKLESVRAEVSGSATGGEIVKVV